jgi:hypothetical protein
MVNPFRAVRDAAKLAEQIVREEVTDPRAWEAELADKTPLDDSNQDGQQ